MRSSDFVIIGAGIVGLTVARELKNRHPDKTVTVLEKEPEPGRHSSGRNSGVLHSGIYYPPGSLKARVCRQGAIEMAGYHEEHGLPLNRCGKVLVAVREEDGPQLEVLAERARQNGVHAERLDAQGISEIEPEARSATGQALWVPSTSVGSPAATLQTLVRELAAQGVDLRFNAEITSPNTARQKLTLSHGDTITYGHLVNAAGLYADRIAHQFGVGRRYTALPFKGLYWKLSPLSGFNIRHLIYPIPDLRVPFLGVHTTTTIEGTTYLGPTAVPAFGRENYRGFAGVTIRDLPQIFALITRQFIQGHDGFRRLAWQEGRRYFKPWFLQAAQAMLPRLRREHLLPSEKVGIRPQLLDRQTGRLVNDFLVEEGPHSTHILNAISPAWTCAFPFARYVCDHLIERNP